jgi:hypothetical protein
MGTPTRVTPIAARVANSRVFMSGRVARSNRAAKLARLKFGCSTGPRNSMNDSTTMAKNGTRASSTTAQQ